MTTLDRYIIRGLIVNYLIALGVMISLYVVLDMFFNMDEFTEGGGGFVYILGSLASFYGIRIFLYFSQLSGVIVLFACLLTLARMRMANELTAMVASGISLYRVAVPVIGFGLVMTGLWYVDTEIVIPSVAHKLARRHDDARGLRTYQVSFLRDRDAALLCAQQYLPGEQVLKQLLVLKRDEAGAIHSAVEADLARWEPTPQGPSAGRWVLERGIERARSTYDPDAVGPGPALPGDPIRYYESDLDPNTIEVRQSAGWVRYLSSARLANLSTRFEGDTARQILQARHARFAAPLVSLLMLCLGLPFILHRVPGNILASGGKALIVCGACYVLAFVAQNVGAADDRFSALPAWFAILVFTPFAVILMDRMRT